MSEAEFRAKRRQKFLTEKYFKLNAEYCADEVKQNGLVIEAGTFEPNEMSYAGIRGSSFKNALKLVRLNYTAGVPIESVKPLYADAMHWLGEWHRAEDEYSHHLAKKSGKDLRLDMTPVEFADLFHFQLALDVVSLGVLLGEGDAVRRAAAWMSSARGTDMLFEAIVEPAVVDARDVEEFFHEEPYGLLIDAIYTADTPEEASAFVKKYLDGWYKAFEGVPWHDGHLVQTDEYSNYEGYWAFEAAAVCVIHNINDSSFRDHIVYPKDLADWAREHKVLDKIKPEAGTNALQLRCEANQPCPREGWWVAVVKANSRRHFKAGELMPDLKSEAGITIWQWDSKQ